MGSAAFFIVLGGGGVDVHAEGGAHDGIVIACAFDEVFLIDEVAADDAAAIAMLTQAKGIGPWTAHYIAMRALGWPDAFPPNDVAVLKAMQRLFGTTKTTGVVWQGLTSTCLSTTSAAAVT